MHGTESGKITSIIGNSSERDLQWCKEFSNWRSDAQDMSPGV